MPYRSLKGHWMSWGQCHFISVVNECRKVLTLAGFKELKERDHWDIKPNDKVGRKLKDDLIVILIIPLLSKCSDLQPWDGLKKMASYW